MSALSEAVVANMLASIKQPDETEQALLKKGMESLDIQHEERRAAVIDRLAVRLESLEARDHDESSAPVVAIKKLMARISG